MEFYERISNIYDMVINDCKLIVTITLDLDGCTLIQLHSVSFFNIWYFYTVILFV